MKLHLPVRLFKSVLACLTAVASFSLGSGVAWAEVQNLIFNGTTLTWDTSEDNKPFVDAEDAAASFAAGDNVSFTGESTVTLGENIAAGTLDIAAGADVTIDLGNYTLHTDTISLSGTLAVGNSLSIASGSTLAVKNAAAVLDSALVLGEKSGLVVESAASLNNNSLTLQGGSNLILTAAGDGKTYTLFSGISSLVDKNGNTLTAGSYSINDYFDKDAPGSGFWADATLVLTVDGTLQLVLHGGEVQEALTISTRQTGSKTYNYYEGICFRDITYTVSSYSSPAYGGAIYGDNIELNNNGSVVFEGNTASGYYSYTHGGAIYGRGDITLSDNGRVTFSENSASDSDGYAYGGAIYGRGDITLSDNGSVEFSENSASDASYGYGGAIYGDYNSTISLSNNGSVTFSGNSAHHGGAIFGYSSSTISLSNNGSVTFSGNSASMGGAIEGPSGSTITLNDNGSVEFIGNTAFSYGAAIFGASQSTITLSNNGSVVFVGNTASFSYAYGGAIAGGDYSTITLSNNGSVTFSGNSAHCGGAIEGGSQSTITLSNNDSVTFSGNLASSADTYADGGAIAGGDYSTITLSNNGSVIFSENSASSTSSYADGGAIYGSTITLSNNDSVTFSGNLASSTSSYANGGAIYGEYKGTISLSNNGSVIFSGNTASSSASAAYGGAIYGGRNLSIRNNESVLFEKNVEKSGSSYRLRSIYAGGSGDVISLSAAAGKSIEFRDSVYIDSGSTVNLNADYTYVDSEGVSVTIKQQGDILFTGKYTETHLNELLASAEAGRTATAEEILNSRTTKVNALTNLYGGRLRVEDGAIYQGRGITAHEGSGATVRVKDATLSHSGYDLTFNAGTTLELAGTNSITGNVQMLEGSTMRLIDTSVNGEEIPLSFNAGTTLELEGTNSITGNVVMKGSSMLAFNYDAALLDAASMFLSGSLTLNGEIALQLKGFEEHEGAYKLISLSSATLTGWGDENIRLQGTDGAEISWYKLFRYGDTVYYVNQNLGTATWTNASGDGKWNNFSYNWEENGKNYAYTQGVDVVFGSETSGSTITLEGDLAVRNMQVTGESSYEIQYAADSSLRIDSALQVESGSSLSLGGAVSAGEVQNAGTMTVLGDMTVQGAVNGAGALTVGGALSAASLNADTLTLTGAEATSRITGDVVLSGAATVAGALEVGGSFTSGTLQAKSLTVDTFISTGKLTGDSNTLTALNGNIELTDEHESLNGDSNVITATGGDVRLTDDMTGSGNVITAVAANGVGGSILRGNGTALWASIVGQHNELTADGRIELESINQGNNTLHAKTGSIVISKAVSGGSNMLTAGTTISTGSMTGSGNTLTAEGGTLSTGTITSADDATAAGQAGKGNTLRASGDMTVGAITGDCNELTSTGGYILLRDNATLDGEYNKLTAAAVVQAGNITGDENELVAGKHVDINGNLNGNNNSITCNATMNTTDNAIDISGTIGSSTQNANNNTLTAVRGNIRTGAITGTGNTLTAQAGNITTGNVSGGGNVLTAQAGSITAASIAGAGNVVTARSLTVTGGLEGATLTLTDGDASNSIGGDVSLSGAATVAGALEVGGSFTSGTLQAKSLTVDTFISTGKLTGDSNTLTALNGNIELTNEHESLNGNSNVITATGGDVRLTDDMTGSRNIITAKAVDGVGGSILRGNGRKLWASIAGQYNELTADGRIELESINQGNNTLIAGGAIVNDGGTISINSINGSTNTLTATNGSIRVGNIGNAAKSDNNRLTAAGHVYVQGQLTGDGNYLESNKAPGDDNSISIWNGINGSGNRILANAGNIAMGGGDLTGDNNTLTSVNGNVSVRNVSGTGNTLSAGKGNIVATSISGTGASLTAANLQVNGAGGLNLTDSALNITGDITSAGNVVLAGSDNTAQWSAGRIAGSGSVSITGGVLELADDTDALAVTGAVSISNAELRGSWTGTGLSVGGSSVAQGAAVVLRDVTLTSSLSNEGSLSFGGAVAVQADGLVSASSFTKYSAGESGYRYEEKAYTLVTGSGTSAAQDGTVWNLSGDENALANASYSYADGILTASGTQELTTYWVNGAVNYDGRSEFDSATTLVLNGGKLTLDSKLGSNLTDGIRVDAASTLSLSSGVEVKRAQLSGVSADNTVSLDGSGKLNLGSSADFTGYALAKGWSGTVKLENITTDTNLDMNTIGQSGSKIELENVMGYTGVNGGTVAADLQLNRSTAADGTEQAALVISNGYSHKTNADHVMTTFSGTVSGAGKMVYEKTLSNEYTGFAFSGDVSGWTGAFEMNGGKTFNLVFGGIATEIKADIRDVSSGSTLNLMLEAETAMTLAGTISTDSIIVSTTPGVAFNGTVNTGKLSAGNSVLTFCSAAAVTGDMSAAGVVLNAGASLDVNGALNTGSLSAAGSAVTLGAASVVSGEMSVEAVVLNAGASLDVGGTLSAAQVTLKELSTTAPTLTVGSFAAGGTIFSLDAAALNALNLGHGESVVIARADSGIGSDFNAWLTSTGSTRLDAAVYRYDISVSGADVQLRKDYANWGTRVWYQGAWVGQDGWSEYMIAGYDAVDGVETVNLGGIAIAADNLIIAPGTHDSTTVLSNGEMVILDTTEVARGKLQIAAGTVLETVTLMADGSDVLLEGQLTVDKGNIGSLSGTTGTLTVGGELSVGSDVTLGTLVNTGTLNLGDHKLDVAAPVLTGGDVKAGEVVVHNRTTGYAKFDALTADKVTVTNSLTAYSDNLSVGDGSVIGELVAEKLQVREGTVTLGRSSGGTEMSLLNLDLQEDATLVLNQQTALAVTDTLTATENATVQLKRDASICYGDTSISNRNESGTVDVNAYALSGKADLVLERAHVSTRSSSAKVVDYQLINSSVENAGTGTLQLTHAGNSLTSIAATSGSVEVYNQAELNLEHLSIGRNQSLAVMSSDVAAGVDEEFEARVNIFGSATFGADSTLIADLSIQSGATIRIEGVVHMGSSITLSSGMVLAGAALENALSLNVAGDYVVLFDGVDSLILDGETPLVYSPGGLTVDDKVLASKYFMGLEEMENLYITFEENSDSESGNSSGGEVRLTLGSEVIPEPTTSTLSLLALAALAARRRRK